MENLNDLRTPPGNRLEQLKGDRQDQYSKRATHSSGKGERPFTPTDKVIYKRLNAS